MKRYAAYYAFWTTVAVLVTGLEILWRLELLEELHRRRR